MATYKITGPDGKQFNVTAPDDATQEQVLAYAQRSFKMAATPTAAPAPPPKGFGEQLNDLIDDAPRQLGLTARPIVQAVGGMADLIAKPVSSFFNSSLRRGRLLDDIREGKLAPTEENMRLAETGRDIPGGTVPFQLTTNSGPAMADALGLPQPKNATERVVGNVLQTGVSALLPLKGAGAIAARAPMVGRTAGQELATQFAANPGTQLLSAGASGAAGGAVRETGGDERSQFLASLLAGLATPFATGGMQRALDATRAMGRSAAIPPQQIDVTINTALRDSGLTLDQLPAQVAQSIRNDVAAAFKTSDQVSPDAVRRLADYRMTGATPTAAGLTLDPAVVTQQRNLAKMGINSKDQVAQQLGQTQNANNRTLTGGLNSLGASTADDALAGGSRVMSALEQRNARAQDLIGQRYAAARAADGRSAALDPSAFTQRANNLLDDALLGGKLPSDVRNLLNRAATGEMPLTVDVAEQFKTRIGELQRSTTDLGERQALSKVRSALDDTPLLPGQQIGQEAMDAFGKARALNRGWMQIVERTPALQAVRDGIEPDKFVQQYIVGSGGKSNVMDVAMLKNSIKGSPEAMDAVREQITAFLKQKALNGAADEVGNFSQSAYNTALKAVGDRKLNLFFTPDQVNQMKAIGRVASYEQFQPTGAAVNNSNTTGAMGGMLERIAGSSMLSKIPFGRAAIGDPLENLMISMQAGRSLNVPQSLAGAPRMPAQLSMQPAGMMLSPAMFMAPETEEEKRRRLLAPAK